MFNRKSFTTTAVAAGALGLAALIGAGAANAGSVDNKFLDSLEKDGISVTDPAATVEYAQEVCAALDRGGSAEDVIAAVENDTGLSHKNAIKFTIDAAKAYCPEYVQQR